MNKGAVELVAPVLAWIDEPADPLVRLQRADAAYMAIADLIRAIGADGRRGEAARALVHEHGMKRAAELAGYSEATMRRVAWK